MTRHVLRNLLSPILVQGTFLFASAMLAEAGLSFLGLGVSPEIPTWGTMIAAGRQYIGQADWMTLFPGLCHHSLRAVAADGRRRTARHSRSKTSKGLMNHVFRI
jgi:ABC-type dipeptide/oligopeptide/nickel transport system permease subunit